MQKMRLKTKYIDVLVRYRESKATRHTKIWEDQFDGIITFRIQYPFLSDSLLKKFSKKLQIEFIEGDNRVYFASSPCIILPSRKGGNYKSKFVHPTYCEDITENMLKYLNILSDLDNLIKEAYEELNSSEISF
ncbi:hypothetical protein [Leptospira kanakyensis]|uniref:hypothetical protein n=1 Tax=Leptospira kanakyensis TaxID=2484968 RepID=UPI00223E1190|nr:hypothetical protein [Leptospira kanakyensis]MCW7470566.1 hypothetical protein [Leptospira kanakyensis]